MFGSYVLVALIGVFLTDFLAELLLLPPLRFLLKNFV